MFTKTDGFRREQPGASFHGWLYGVTRFKVLDHFRRVSGRPNAIGGTDALVQLQETPAGLPEAQEDQQIQQERLAIYQQAYEVLQTDFEQHTWKAFWRVAVDGAAAASVAEELEMSVGAVYNAKFKVLKRLRAVFDGLM